MEKLSYLRIIQSLFLKQSVGQKLKLILVLLKDSLGILEAFIYNMLYLIINSLGCSLGIILVLGNLL